MCPIGLAGYSRRSLDDAKEVAEGAPALRTYHVGRRSLDGAEMDDVPSRVAPHPGVGRSRAPLDMKEVLHGSHGALVGKLLGYNLQSGVQGEWRDGGGRGSS